MKNLSNNNQSCILFLYKKFNRKKVMKDNNQEQEEIFEIETEEEIDDVEIELEDFEAEGESLQNKIKKLRLALKESKNQSQEYLTGWQKERADFANFKATEEKKRKERVTAMKLNLVSDFFPVLDSFDMAFSNKEAWEKVDPAWRTGVEYIHTQFMNTLEGYSVSLIDNANVEFDPMIHEPIEHVEVNNPEGDNKIISIIQKGYMSGDVVLRPAKVKVGKYEA